ncbi:MAG: hypothetical protein JXB07_08665 [Anaerolineae bacterium]|nr:hypothetical protein [Anaerolineae bacterium]
MPPRAAFALAELGDEQALDHLLAILQDSTQPWGVRERAAYSVLNKTGSSSNRCPDKQLQIV